MTSHIERMEVLNYQELGRKFIEWAEDESTRPTTFDELLQQLDGIIALPLPSWITGFEFKQVDVEQGILLMRLPPKALIADTRQRISEGQSYVLPEFYEERLVQGQHQDPFGFFEFRVGDYVIAHCM